MPFRYPPEFHRKILDLLAAGRPVASVAGDLGVSDQTIQKWRNQEPIDTSRESGLSSAERAEMRAARRRIAELETELAVTRRANELLKEQLVSPKDGSKRSHSVVMGPSPDCKGCEQVPDRNHVIQAE